VNLALVAALWKTHSVSAMGDSRTPLRSNEERKLRHCWVGKVAQSFCDLVGSCIRDHGNLLQSLSGRRSGDRVTIAAPILERNPNEERGTASASEEANLEGPVLEGESLEPSEEKTSEASQEEQPEASEDTVQDGPQGRNPEATEEATSKASREEKPEASTEDTSEPSQEAAS
jgi:hypothetical protein